MALIQGPKWGLNVLYQCPGQNVASADIKKTWAQTLNSLPMLLFLSILTTLSSRDVVPVWFVYEWSLCLSGASFLLVSPVEMRTLQGHWHLVWIPLLSLGGPSLVISSLYSMSPPGSLVTASLDIFLSKRPREWSSGKDSLAFLLQQFPKIKLSCRCLQYFPVVLLSVLESKGNVVLPWRTVWESPAIFDCLEWGSRVHETYGSLGQWNLL